MIMKYDIAVNYKVYVKYVMLCGIALLTVARNIHPSIADRIVWYIKHKENIQHR